MGLLDGKVAIVTGAAMGIGAGVGSDARSERGDGRDVKIEPAWTRQDAATTGIARAATF